MFRFGSTLAKQCVILLNLYWKTLMKSYLNNHMFMLTSMMMYSHYLAEMQKDAVSVENATFFVR